MTTFGFQDITCAHCGAVSNQQILTSTNTFGSPDLDLRPPEMQRSTMDFWLQECPACGFVSSELDDAEEGIRDILATDAYQSLLTSERSGKPASRFLRRSLIDEKLGRFASAAEQILCAAWAADDEGTSSAAEYRSRSADLFLMAIEAMPREAGETITLRTRVVDILRRSERWEEAIGIATVLLAEHDLDPTIRSVVEFGRSLAQNHDASAHTVQDAVQAA